MNYYKYITFNYFYDAGEESSSTGVRLLNFYFLNTLKGNTTYFNLESGRWYSQVIESPISGTVEDGLF